MFSRVHFILLAVLLIPAISGMAVNAQAFETKAKQAFMIESETGTILFAKNADDLVPPASLAKLMTMELVFEALSTGQLTLEDTFQVSENAWRTGGAVSGTSTMFAELNSSVPLADLIRGVIVQSGNDASIIIAEGMAGSEEGFASLMTDRARKLGMEKSVFGNATGLPHPDAGVTMRDLVLLADHIQTTYPQFYPIYSETEFTWNGITQQNRNPLLRLDIGVDGLKTGYTEESGYAIVSSIERDGRRLTLAMSGMTSLRERAEEARKMLEWGLRTFRRLELFDSDEIIGEASVYGGDRASVPLEAKGAVDIFVSRAGRDRLRARIVYDWPLNAPVNEGDHIATLNIWVGDTLSQQTPLFAAETVERGPIHRRALDALQELLFFWI